MRFRRNQSKGLQLQSEKWISLQNDSNKPCNLRNYDMEKKKKTSLDKNIAVSKSVSTDFELGTDNIFADLGLPNPEEELAKAKLATEIFHIIKQKKLTQVKAADLLGVDQAKI